MGWGLVHRMAESGGTSSQEGAALNAWRTTTATLSALGTAFGSLLRGNQRRARVELGPGDIAPDFALAASDGRTYRLADFRGRSTVVMAWFPKAFTSGCTAECTSIGLTGHALGAFDATIFAASCDTVDTNRAFAASMGIDVPILSDPDQAVARAYGVLGPLGLPSRWTVYIGSDGRILAIDRGVHTSSHGADIASALQQFGVSRRP
jgi:thioredoxin-dependent peroxiredoxin